MLPKNSKGDRRMTAARWIHSAEKRRPLSPEMNADLCETDYSYQMYNRRMTILDNREQEMKKRSALLKKGQRNDMMRIDVDRRDASHSFKHPNEVA